MFRFNMYKNGGVWNKHVLRQLYLESIYRAVHENCKRAREVRYFVSIAEGDSQIF